MDKRNKYTSALAAVPILGTLTPYERDTISDALVPCLFKKGEFIIKQGEKGDKFYILLSGELEALKSVNGGEHQNVGNLKENAFFGEIALLTDKPRAASIRVTSDVAHCVYLDREAFTRVLGPVEDILRRNLATYKLYTQESA